MTDRAALVGAERSPLQTWRGVLACSLGVASYFYVFVHRVSPSIMVDELMRDFPTNGAVGVISSSAGPPVGPSARSLSSSRQR
jgi:hypothetical protein